MLSGGERKRVALASVLAWNPKVVVLDEPTTGQDHGQKERLSQFVRQLNAQGRTVILVTHDIEFVAECSPRVILMSRGRIIADGPAKEILTNSKLVTEASLIVPQITQLFMMLGDLGLPGDVIDIYEAKRLINDFVGG
jgi:energy-coupling factor transport system ATP-binding protein